MSAFDAIPQELRERDQWVIWRLEERDGKQTKVPYRCDGQGRASTTDAATWASYETAVDASLFADGIGYVFSPDDPYVGVDLDTLDGDAGAIILALDSYTENSFSGQGAHVIVRASLNGHPRHRHGPLEIYGEGRYFVFTGDHMHGTPTEIHDRQEQLERVLAEFLPAEDHAAPPPPTVPVDLDDQELLDRAFAAKNGSDFKALWHGLWEGSYPSQSEADLALCSMLAFWTGRDPARMDRLFRASGLIREKWDSRRGESNYGSETISLAIRDCTSVYSELRYGHNAVDAVTQKQRSQADREGVLRSASALKDAVRPDADPQRDHQNAATTSDPNAEPRSERPFAMPIREFVALEREQREPLLADVDGRAAVGRASLTLMGGLGGHGKTTKFVDLALHMAAGVDYPPWTVPKPVSILIVENEGPEDAFAAKLEQRLASFPHELRAPLDVFTLDWGGFSLADEEIRRRLVEQIAEKQYDIVFGDPLDSLGIEGVGSPEDTRKFLELMKQTGLNKTVAWWLNTHPRKEETKEALNEISGAWGGKPDTVLLLKRLDDDRMQLRQPKLRWARRGKGPTLLFAFDAETEQFKYIGEEADEERDYLTEIKTLLADGEWRTAREIAEKKHGGIGAGDKTITSVLVEHPDVFESRTGDAAKALGRKSTATLWQLRGGDDEQPEQTTLEESA